MNEQAICENCHNPFTARQTAQRFCSRECGLEYFQQEKREAVSLYRLFKTQPTKLLQMLQEQKEARAS